MSYRLEPLTGYLPILPVEGLIEQALQVVQQVPEFLQSASETTEELVELIRHLDALGKRQRLQETSG